MRQHFITKLISLLFLIILIPLTGFAEDAAGETSNLFISSTPLNADILIDGRAVIQKTPALSAGMSPGAHTISIRKEGFTAVDLEVELIPGKTEVIRAELFRKSVVVSLPGAEAVYLRTDDEKLLPEAFLIPEGGFSISSEDNRYYIEPTYPYEGFYTLTNVLFATSAILTIAAYVYETQEYGETNLPHSTGLSIIETAAFSLAITEIALYANKKKYMEDFKVYSADLSKLEAEAESLYQRAQRSMAVGNLEESLTGFSRLVSDYHDSARFPEALYKIAKIHIISGDTNLAVSELKIIIENFPDPEIYDKACQTLALLYFNSGEPEKSRESVEKMVYYDPLFSNTEDEIETFGIDEVIENWARNPERQAD